MAPVILLDLVAYHVAWVRLALTLRMVPYICLKRSCWFVSCVQHRKQCRRPCSTSMNCNELALQLPCRRCFGRRGICGVA